MNGLENKYIIKNNKRLRYGYTTGSCAAGAASGAVRMLLSGSTGVRPHKEKINISKECINKTR